MSAAEAKNDQYLELAELAGGFIHEIKNHLNTLSLNLQLLAEDVCEPETPRERKALARVQRLNDQCRKLLTLSNDFLRYARVHELERRPTNLTALITRLVDFLEPTARAQGISIHWFPTELPALELDEELFDKVLLNLLLNAEDAMPDGGNLTIQVQLENGTVSIDIIDDGSGMPPEIVGKVFRPFVTTKPNGHGLGLATAKKIVEAHQGQIELQTEANRGTKFTIRLPAPNGC